MAVDLNLFRPLFTTMARDSRLTVWHIATILAIVQLANEKDISSPILISRRKVMEIAHINSFMTYHKCIKELVAFGYIDYTPSYHPAIGSEIYFRKTVKSGGIY